VQDVKLDGALVKGVSRSFYLTLRLLPSNIREVISLGYLLARASDTIADTANLNWERRRECLGIYNDDCIKGKASPDLLKVVAESFTQQKHKGERILMAQMESVLSAINVFSLEEQEILKKLIETIIQGQLWDLEYFQGRDRIKAVKSEEQLDHYTYQVAGCVGEFWTLVLVHHGYLSLSQKDQMVIKGVNYGKGLQLTNIVRDIGEDFANGRGYIPEAGESLEGILILSEKWIDRAKDYLQDGIEYAKVLPKGRLRVATELPAKLGVETLELLENSTLEDRATQKVKISRRVVFKELAKCFIS